MNWPDWLNYATIRRALLDFGGPHADEIGLAVLLILVVGLAIRLIVVPLRRR